MLIIFEGLDKSGKTTLAARLHELMPGSCMIRKQYHPDLYPVDFGRASVYDWQTILDRVVLANPNMTFIADRSFFTQTIYQLCLGTGEHAIDTEQLNAFNSYCKVMTAMPHIVILCESAHYELDNIVTNLSIYNALLSRYKQVFRNIDNINLLHIDMDNTALIEQLTMISDNLLANYNDIQPLI